MVRDYNFVHLSSGDLLRNQIREETRAGLEAKRYVDDGKLVPDSFMVQLFMSEVEKLKQNWLLDGFPRTVGQAKALDARQDIDIVINLDVPFETIVERIQKRLVHEPSGRTYHTEFHPPQNHGIDDITGEPLTQRSDDRPEAVRERLKVYEALTTPVLQYYKKQDKLERFSGTESNEIWPRVKSLLDTITKS
ncbi:GTP:AMP phosphotransferase AK3, mitochondrial-like [Oscarella lobularis]|uniref:GTP:AMP phosphotransferase AK3, mitochondrial-like n=1 Tax=Oscarella lobularis TaxID=121494 RepID=UPI0033141D3C